MVLEAWSDIWCGSVDDEVVACCCHHHHWPWERKRERIRDEKLIAIINFWENLWDLGTQFQSQSTILMHWLVGLFLISF